VQSSMVVSELHMIDRVKETSRSLWNSTFINKDELYSNSAYDHVLQSKFYMSFTILLYIICYI